MTCHPFAMKIYDVLVEHQKFHQGEIQLRSGLTLSEKQFIDDNLNLDKQIRTKFMQSPLFEHI